MMMILTITTRLANSADDELRIFSVLIFQENRL